MSIAGNAAPLFLLAGNDGPLLRFTNPDPEFAPEEIGIDLDFRFRDKHLPNARRGGRNALHYDFGPEISTIAEDQVMPYMADGYGNFAGCGNPEPWPEYDRANHSA